MTYEPTTFPIAELYHAAHFEAFFCSSAQIKNNVPLLFQDIASQKILLKR